MQKTCSGYTKQSSICNCKVKGKCSLATITEISRDKNISIRCPRLPYKNGKDNYIQHKS